MLSITLQLDLLLAALSALLPLVPEQHRAKATEILDTASDVANAAISVGGHLTDFAQKLAQLRAEIAAMGDRVVTADDMDQALIRVRTASAAFRAAIETAAAPAT